MGALELIHGVSASSVALILGIYQEFIHSFSAIDRQSIALLRTARYKEFWKSINGAFLAVLMSGIIVGFILLASVALALMQKHFIILNAFLFGIILISGLLLLRKVIKWRIVTIALFVCGLLATYFVSELQPVESPNSYVLAPVAGFLAGFSFVIPGISGAFILILIGKYQLIVTSFSALNFGAIALFLSGCLPGLWLASRFMSRILAGNNSVAVALLAGLMIGALNKLWPWRYIREYVTTNSGEQVPALDESILPWHYMALTGKDPQVFQAILMMALGVFIVVLTEKITAGLKTKI
jgi:putative membrane protein